MVDKMKEIAAYVRNNIEDFEVRLQLAQRWECYLDGRFKKISKVMKKLYAHDWGKYIGLYKRRSCTELWGAVWKDDKRCMDEWEEIKKTHKIEWI